MENLSWLQDWRKIPRIARFIGLFGILISGQILLKYAHILPQSKAMAASLLDYPSVFQHTVLVLEEFALFAGSLLLLKRWRMSRVLFSVWFASHTANAIYRTLHPSDRMLQLQHRFPAIPAMALVIVLGIEFAITLYVWHITSKSGWFDDGSKPEMDMLRPAS